ncbi:hypothetical protein NB709_002417 [Xanthomonas sacchari]|nr:hypothetical protein [Xanthomonas sacchari]MCW0396090.1 hypothetical protein [Xanthomonas sacchari]MCW0412541.1 hypothetical protein [Xanthomonas sacchari]MCW0439741.1 hypothetical protein [Xanthomonas sacchari]MCW0445672.1 hypothetical protein [Xanthomonas sacchari]
MHGKRSGTADRGAMCALRGAAREGAKLTGTALAFAPLTATAVGT